MTASSAARTVGPGGGRSLIRFGAIVACVALAAAGSAPAQPRPGSPVAFLARIIHLQVAGRFAAAWPSLNPRDQAIAPLAAYVACEAQRPVAGTLTSLRAVRVRRDRVGVAVTFVLRLTTPLAPTGVVVRVTRHAVPAGGRWTWILSQSRRSLYRSGCGIPAGPPT